MPALPVELGCRRPTGVVTGTPAGNEHTAIPADTGNGLGVCVWLTGGSQSVPGKTPCTNDDSCVQQPTCYDNGVCGECSAIDDCIAMYGAGPAASPYNWECAGDHVCHYACTANSNCTTDHRGSVCESGLCYCQSDSECKGWPQVCLKL